MTAPRWQRARQLPHAEHPGFSTWVLASPPEPFQFRGTTYSVYTTHLRTREGEVVPACQCCVELLPEFGDGIQPESLASALLAQGFDP